MDSDDEWAANCNEYFLLEEDIANKNDQEVQVPSPPRTRRRPRGGVALFRYVNRQENDGTSSRTTPPPPTPRDGLQQSRVVLGNDEDLARPNLQPPTDPGILSGGSRPPLNNDHVAVRNATATPMGRGRPRGSQKQPANDKSTLPKPSSTQRHSRNPKCWDDQESPSPSTPPKRKRKESRQRSYTPQENDSSGSSSTPSPRRKSALPQARKRTRRSENQQRISNNSSAADDVCGTSHGGGALGSSSVPGTGNPGPLNPDSSTTSGSSSVPGTGNPGPLNPDSSTTSGSSSVPVASNQGPSLPGDSSSSRSANLLASVNIGPPNPGPSTSSGSANPSVSGIPGPSLPGTSSSSGSSNQPVASNQGPSLHGTSSSSGSANPVTVQLYPDNPEPQGQQIIRRRGFLEKWFGWRRNVAIDQKRKLIFAIPSKTEGVEFSEKMEHYRLADGPIYYTICNEESEFLAIFMSDPDIFDNYELFHDDISMHRNDNDPAEWLCLFSLYHVLRTHLQDRIPGLKAEFVFHKDLRNLIPAAFLKRWGTIIHDKLPLIIDCLKRGAFFCTEDGGECPDSCRFRSLFFHRSTFRMTRMTNTAVRSATSTKTTWRLRDNEDELRDHPISALFSSVEYDEPERTIDEICNEVVRRTTLQLDALLGWTVYILLVVTDENETPKIETLSRLYTEGNADFAAYAGCSREAAYRHEHLGANTRSPVSQAMTPRSKVFLAYSQRFITYREASQREACLIESMKADQAMHNAEDRKMRYRGLNIRSESAVLLSVDNNMMQSLQDLVALQIPLFRFRNDPRPNTPNVGFIPGQYEIIRPL